MLQRENKQKKNRFCIKETNLITIAKKKNTKTKGLFYFNKNYQFLKKIVIALVAPLCHTRKKKYEKDLYSQHHPSFYGMPKSLLLDLSFVSILFVCASVHINKDTIDLYYFALRFDFSFLQVFQLYFLRISKITITLFIEAEILKLLLERNQNMNLPSTEGG